MSSPQLLCYFVWALLACSALGNCPRACSFNGLCSTTGRCSCFSGWKGNDCSLRSCPTGYSIADIPNSKDSAHVLEECSGRGTCEVETATCLCERGWTGSNCGKPACMNDCSGRGECISLTVAAVTFDGYTYNHTTSYTRWDANSMYGCKCDQGYSGADCSQKMCEYGLDPRRSMGTAHEIVTLVCTCSTGNCGGKFKLRFLGSPTRTWLYPSSKAYEVANSLMITYGNTSLHNIVPIVAYNNSVNSVICPTKAGQVVKTRIKFRRFAGDVPAVSFYANAITGGSMYFETTQTLSCDCTRLACNGTFRVSFDGEMSSRMMTYGNGSAVISALKNMKTIQSAGIIGVSFRKNISVTETTSVCRPGFITNHTYVFKAQSGNLPRLGLWSSVVGYKSPSSYNSVNATYTLTLKTNDGRDDNLKVCNGIGRCDFSTGVCQCPAGYGLDPDMGPCAKIMPPTSKFNGVGRCPGIVSVTGNNFDGTKVDLSKVPSHSPRLYMSHNPMSASSTTRSFVVYYDWAVSAGQFPNINQASRKFLFSMTTTTSAGPIILDQAKERIFFVDANLANPFIGVAVVNASFNASVPYSIWTYTSCNVFGFAFNANFNQRKIFWTCPGSRLKWDGGVYFANVDDPNAIVYNFGALLGVNIADPMGIAFNYLDSRIYWLDHNIVDPSIPQNVLVSAKLDGSGYLQTNLPTTIGNHQLSLNLTDLVIDFVRNNTAFFFDNQLTSSVLLAMTLNTQKYYDVTTDPNSNLWSEMTASRVVQTSLNKFGNPRYVAIDDNTETVFWSDTALQKVSYTFATRNADPFNYSNVYTDQERQYVWGGVAAYPVGLSIDDGLSTPTFNAYLDCYGNGVCLGAAGNYECACFDGFFGDCQARMCPKGLAWFSQPFVDNIAHDIFVECSNAGTCNRGSGICTCQPGYEGAACDRLMCPGQTDNDHYCNGNGRCLSMRELASKHKTKYLDQSIVVTYGSSARNPATWDADMIYGCVGDEYGYYMNSISNITSYRGYKSHRRECPYAFDARDLQTLTRNTTYNQITFNNNGTLYQKEIQQFICVANGGSFTLTFRGATTSPISFASTTNTLISALDALPTVGNVTVHMSSTATPGSICAISGNAGNITFLTELSLTPLLKVTTNALSLTQNSVTSSGSFTVTRIQKGKGSLFECAGKGDCDETTGQCACYDGYASSDGYAHFGSRGDCGRTSIM